MGGMACLILAMRNPDVDAFVSMEVVDPVTDFEQDLAENTIVEAGDCEVDLNGRRGAVTADPFEVLEAGVRNSETNEGNLIADALLWQGQQLAADFDAPMPMVGIQNGGGIRNDSIIDCSDDGLTELDTFDMVPFANFVTIIEVPREQFAEVLENAVSAVEFGSGRFAQVAGFSFTYDRTGTPREGDEDGNEVTPGSRIIDVTLDDGTEIIVDGVVQPGGDVAIATIDFLGRGGDSFPYRGTVFTSVGVSYQNAVFNYITGAAADDALDGVLSADDYPEGGEGRIVDEAN
jgi:5'-nucleotidase